MSHTIEDQKRWIEKKLDQLKVKEFLSPDLIGLIADVTSLQGEARKNAKPAMPPGVKLSTADQLAQGKPLLIRSEFTLKLDIAKELFTKLLKLVSSDKTMGNSARKIQEKLENGELNLDQAFNEHLSGHDDFFASWSENFPDSPKILDFLIQSAISPEVEALGQALSEQLNQDTPHPSGQCPVCGSLPLISTLKKKEGFRFMTCSFCRTEYRVHRLACPFCGENDPKKLRFFKVEEEPGFRVDVCDSCKYYIKTIDFRALDNLAFPVLDDLASLPLDFLACDQGFKRATLSAWGF